MTYGDPLRSLKRQRGWSLVVTGLGITLVAMMVVVESEPGGTPVLILLGGLVWHLVTRARIRAHQRK